MPVYGTIILAALVVALGVELAVDQLNLRALSPEVPREFRDVYDPERYRRAQDYLRARTRFGMLGASLDLAVVLAFWLTGGFAALDGALRRLGLASVPTGLLFIGILGLGRVLLALPLRWWSTFVIEARFGFNRTTSRTFWTDLAKALLLSLALGGPLLAAILWLLTVAGGRAWLWCWLASATVALVVQFIAPAWLMPLFNRFAPLPEGGLRDAILAYARSVAFPLAGVFVIDGSRRSTKANALFTGFGRHKRVALFDTLVEKLDAAEVVAVVAHEIGHYKCRHVIQGMLLGIAQLGLTFFLLSLVLDRRALFEAFYLPEPSVHAGLVFFALLLTPLELVVSPLLHALSRRNESEADAFAAATTGAGEVLARGLERLSADSLANLTPHPLYVLLHYSHPPLLERVRALGGRHPAAAETAASGHHARPAPE